MWLSKQLAIWMGDSCLSSEQMQGSSEGFSTFSWNEMMLIWLTRPIVYSLGEWMVLKWSIKSLDNYISKYSKHEGQRFKQDEFYRE